MFVTKFWILVWFVGSAGYILLSLAMRLRSERKLKGQVKKRDSKIRELNRTIEKLLSENGVKWFEVQQEVELEEDTGLTVTKF